MRSTRFTLETLYHYSFRNRGCRKWKQEEKSKKKRSGPTHSKGRHAACISITTLRNTHLTTAAGTNLVVWLFYCKLGLLRSLFYTTVITFAHYVVPQLLRSRDSSGFFSSFFHIARSKAWKSCDQKHLIIHEIQTFFNPLERCGCCCCFLIFLVLLFFFLVCFFILQQQQLKKRVINGDNKIKSMRGLCNLFNAQYSWVSARK